MTPYLSVSAFALQGVRRADLLGLHGMLLLSLVLFCLGLFAVLSRRHLIGILIGVELMLNAASLNFIAFNRFIAAGPDSNPVTGQIFVLFIIGLAAAEAAVALSIILAAYRARRSADVDQLDQLKG